MVKIITFKKEHLDCMDMREHELQLLSTPGYADLLEQTSIACTGIINGKIICCGGVRPFLNGNSEIWLIPSIYLQENIVLFTKTLKEWLFQVREDLALHRMQTVAMDDELHNNWMEFLGFEREGVLRQYNNGVNYIMWSRLFNGGVLSA